MTTLFDLSSYKKLSKRQIFSSEIQRISVIRTISTGIIELMKCHLGYQNVNVQVPCLNVGGTKLIDMKCTNKTHEKRFSKL